MIDVLEGQLKKLARPIAIKLAEVIQKTFPVKLSDEEMRKGLQEIGDQLIPQAIDFINKVDTDKLLKELREVVKNVGKS